MSFSTTSYDSFFIASVVVCVLLSGSYTIIIYNSKKKVCII